MIARAAAEQNRFRPSLRTRSGRIGVVGVVGVVVGDRVPVLFFFFKHSSVPLAFLFFNFFFKKPTKYQITMISIIISSLFVGPGLTPCRVTY